MTSLAINEVHEGNCLELMKEIPSKSVDMILCDLPYGTTQNKWDIVIPFEPLWTEYLRIIKDNGAIVLTSAQPFTSSLIMSNVKNFKYIWYWDKIRSTGFLNAKKQPLRVIEDVCVFYKKQATYNPQFVKGKKHGSGGASKENVITGGNYGDFIDGTASRYTDNYYPKNLLSISSERGLHPTQKPLELFEYLIKTYTNEGETVLDNCIGSGTTAIAAINTKRNYIGIEQDAEYVRIARARVAEVSGGGCVG